MATLDSILQVYGALRDEMKQRWNRFVPTGELLQDRWTRAKAMGFGEGTSIYDSTVVLGDVKVGEHCWIGPNVYLDGAGGLTIGNYVTVGVGSTLFTHSSLERDLSAGKFPVVLGNTNIGNHVFMAPHCVVEMGAHIGDYSVVMSHSVVKWPVPAYTIVHGSPARSVGKVIIEAGARPSLRYTREGMAMIKSARDTFL